MSAAYEQVNQPVSPGRDESRYVATDPALARVGGASVVFVGLLTILVSAWGGIVPFVGPSFGFGATGTGSWYWNLSHAVLALAPGAVGVLAGLSMLTAGSRIAVGLGRMSLVTAGFLAFLAGAWFVIGPSAWPVIVRSGHYFVAASALRVLTDRLGYAFGPGTLLAAFGAFTMGWASRHRRLTATALVTAVAPAPAAPDGRSGREPVLTSVASPTEPRHMMS